MKYKPSGKRKVNPLEALCKKTIYTSLIEAQESIVYLQENKHVKDLSAYKCSMCGFWHLTSK
jgi:hypothetical protein